MPDGTWGSAAGGSARPSFGGSRSCPDPPSDRRSTRRSRAFARLRHLRDGPGVGVGLLLGGKTPRLPSSHQLPRPRTEGSSPMFLRHRARPVVVISILVSLVAAGVFAVVVTAGGRADRPQAAIAQGEDGDSSELGVDPDAGEEADEVETVATERAHDALRDGHTQLGAIQAAPAAGWAGQTIVGGGDNDWEPAIAADRSSPYV